MNDSERLSLRARFKTTPQSGAGVDAYWTSLVVSGGAKDVRISAYPPKCRHVIIPLRRLDLRMSTFSSVEMGCLKAFAEGKLRMSTSAYDFCSLISEPSRSLIRRLTARRIRVVLELGGRDRNRQLRGKRHCDRSFR
jgi:hypothetical protein